MIFRHVYDYCTNVNNQGGRGNSVSITSTASSKAKKSQAGGGAQFVGHELYKRLKDYLKSHLINVLKVCLLIDQLVTYVFQALRSNCFDRMESTIWMNLFLSSIHNNGKSISSAQKY